MNGYERITRIFERRPVDRPPTMPIIHTGLARACGVKLGEFFTDSGCMADVIARGHQEFGFDGVQLSLGVTAEAEALGARVEQPPDGGPVLRQHLLAEGRTINDFDAASVSSGGRMPLFFDAVKQVVEAVGTTAYVLVTLRGPLLIASQLRGVKQILMDMIERPDETGRILDFAVDVGIHLGAWLRSTGAHGVLLGEATCSPDFIPPDFYRTLVVKRHRRLVAGLKAAGWHAVGLHICGNTQSIIDDIVSTGVDFMDVDYQVPAADALALAKGRMVLRGNLDPSAVFRYGDTERVDDQTRALTALVRGKPWILSSGCDIPPGTPAENLTAFVAAAGRS